MARKFANMIVLRGAEAAAWALRGIGLYFAVYLLTSAFYPWMHFLILKRVGAENAYWPLWSLALAASLGLLLERMTVASAIALLLFMTGVQSLSVSVVDLPWSFLGWVLAAHILRVVGRLPAAWLWELGWFIAGVTFFIHGIAKLVHVPHAWLTGEVVKNILVWSQPRLIVPVWESGWFLVLCQVLGWAMLALHCTLGAGRVLDGATQIIQLVFSGNVILLLRPNFSSDTAIGVFG